MAQPQAYNRTTDFTAQDGDSTDHVKLNAELDAAATSINQIRDNIALVQADDGTLRNGIVKAENLDPSALNAILGETAQQVLAAELASENALVAASQAQAASTTAVSASATAVDARDDALQAVIDAGNAATAAIRGIYYGPLASDPVLDPNGAAVQVGDLYYNTTAQNTRVYNGSSWVDVAQGVSTPTQVFTGNGVQTAFTLSGTPGSLGSLEVFISGVRQVPTTDYTLSGTTLTFTSPPPAGTANIFARWISTQPINVPADGSVTEGIVNGAVTESKIAAGAVTEPKIATGAVTEAKIGAGAVTPTKVAAGTFGINISGNAATATAAGSATTATNQSGGTVNATSFNGGQLAGMRNKIINGDFRINQRAYASGGATTAGQYTFDRWKVTATGGITFSTTANKTTVTIPSGQTLQQVIEGLNLESGTYVLSWEGTAQGRINGGSYGASGSVTAALTGGSNATIEFNTGTVTSVQLELGTVATPFERRHVGQELTLCQRYHQLGGVAVTSPSSMLLAAGANFVVPMRTTPTMVRTGQFLSSGETGTNFAAFNERGFTYSNNAAIVAGGLYTATAEL